LICPGQYIHIGMIQPKLDNQQRELYATVLVRTYTSDVYVGPDIRWECLEQMANCDDQSSVYLEPVQGSQRRVIVAVLKNEEQMSDICKQLIPLCYAITQCVKDSTNNRLVVKWMNICDV